MKVYLEPCEVEHMEEQAPCVRDQLLIRLLLRLGCRVSEALSVQVDDIDFDQGTVTIEHLEARTGTQALCLVSDTSFITGWKKLTWRRRRS